MKWLYHAIRRFFYPELYWTQEELDEAKRKGKELYEFFKDN